MKGGIFVSEINNGIRFDIYERVHLPDNVAAIDELEEIELVPRIQVIDQGEHAVLQGQLVLNGIYRAQGSADEQVALEHWIPVEISLPMNRVTRLDEITVDIDTFDVVLLSSRALNITGVLSLRGISLEQEEEEHVWSSEAFVASHARTEEDEQDQLQGDDQYAYRNEENGQEEEIEANEQHFFASYLQQDESESEQFIQRHDELQVDESELQEESYELAAESYELAAESDAESEVVYSYAEQDEEEVIYSYSTEDTAASEADAERNTADYNTYDNSIEGVVAQQWEQNQNDEAEQAEYEPIREQYDAQQDEQEAAEDDSNEEMAEVRAQEREMHVALNGNKNQNETLGIRSILNSSIREQAAHQATLLQQETERLQEEAAKPQVVEEEVEWQQLFLSKRPDQNEFRRIRMCIVQKEDTLEDIAGRYNINPRDLLAANNLHESAISEGQLLYIP